MAASTWTLDEGLNLIRALQPKTREFGYHLCLGGGVMNKGISEKDLDLYFLPLDNPTLAKANPQELINWLVTLWGDYSPIGKEYDPDDVEVVVDDGPFQQLNLEPRKNSAYKFKLKFNRPCGDRIDVFIL